MSSSHSHGLIVVLFLAFAEVPAHEVAVDYAQSVEWLETACGALDVKHVPPRMRTI
ncbi:MULTISPECIES: hypothetical protein [Actinomycetes]|uniref:hypothetical protein n=1 Tax=Actinomycetes TaxID=1760 RepID=UPI0001B54597|nr:MULTISPECIES: hypothetical protein [Actinomycetes]EFL08844.1 predicted protein [Streptomyces sp. AA4]